MLAMSDSVRKSSAKKVVPFLGTDDIKKAGEEILVSYKVLEDVWKKAEEKLSFSHVPVNVKVKVGSGFIGSNLQPHGEETTYLGYGRVKGQWRICLVEEQIFYSGSDPEEMETSTWTPISEASVHWRMEMINHFPELCAEVVTITRKFVEELKKKATAFESSLNLFDLF